MTCPADMSPAVILQLSLESSTPGRALWLHAPSPVPQPVESEPHLTRKGHHQSIRHGKINAKGNNFENVLDLFFFRSSQTH